MKPETVEDFQAAQSAVDQAAEKEAQAGLDKLTVVEADDQPKKKKKSSDTD